MTYFNTCAFRDVSGLSLIGFGLTRVFRDVCGLSWIGFGLSHYQIRSNFNGLSLSFNPFINGLS